MTAPTPDINPGTGRRAVILLVLAVTLARLVYLALWCPYTLVEDEAHYWEWSRRLEWSYYSKGPGVAWAIAASTWTFRQLGLAVNELAVRLPSVLAGAVLMLAVAALAREVTRERRAGLLAAACVLLAPVFQFGALLMTIDIPYAACWALAALAGWRALRGGSRWAWVGLGAALGAGFLFKYTILLLVPGLLGYGLLMAKRRRLNLAQNWRAWLLAGSAAAALGLAPVFIWNSDHGWPTFRHLLGHLGMAGGDVHVPAGKGWRYKPAWTLELMGAQIGLIGPLIVLMGWAWVHEYRSRRQDPQRWTDRSFLLWCAAPILLFYLGVSFIAEPEGNWPLAGYITLFPLAGAAIVEGQRRWRERAAAWRAGTGPRPRSLPRMIWRMSLVVGILAAVLSARVDLIAGSAALRLGQRALYRWGVIKQDRPLIPLGRLTGAREMARSAERLLEQVRRDTGQEPFLIAQHYGRASTLAFYMTGRPTVFCSSAKGDGRRTQYDLWEETSLDNPALRGRPAVLVGGYDYEWRPAFESITLHGPLEGETKRNRDTFIGLGYRGFPPLAAPSGSSS